MNIQENLNEIREKESFLEKIKRFIPGYDGYVNRDNARELDTQLRNALALSLDYSKVQLKNAVLQLGHNKKLFELPDVDKLEKKLDNIISKLKSASRGYSGAFDVVKIKEDKLFQLYEFDSSLATMVETVNEGFDNFVKNTESDVDDIIKLIQQLGDILDNFLKKFDERETLLRNLN
ncbi:MAG: hypothetical protein ACP5P3_00350 [Ignavibacteria bacterium]